MDGKLIRDATVSRYLRRQDKESEGALECWYLQTKMPRHPEFSNLPCGALQTVLSLHLRDVASWS